MKTMKIALSSMVVITASCLAAAQQSDSFDGCAKQFQGKGKIRVSPGVIEGLVLKKTMPEAVDLRPVRNSNVKVKVMIDETGTVQCAAGIEGDSSLYERSIQAAREWKFRPYILNGQPIVVESAFYFHFNKGKVSAKFSY
jgi:hypothetical protein